MEEIVMEYYKLLMMLLFMNINYIIIYSLNIDILYVLIYLMILHNFFVYFSLDSTYHR